MSKIKYYMMDMEEAVVDAIEGGAECIEDVYAYVGTVLPFYDKAFVKKLFDEFFGDYCEDMNFKYGEG
jgi:hypothetical protein